ncbi:MAG: cobalamin-binding protein [Nitrospiria bacterium]
MKDYQRIVSFLPGATEMIYSLHLEDRLVGVTHACDFPPAARNKPVVIKNVIPVEAMSSGEIDTAVRAYLKEGKSLYQIEENLLFRLVPDLIVTQDLCQVCAPSGNEAAEVLKMLSPKPDILWFTPKSIGDIFENFQELGRATDRVKEAEKMITSGKARIEKIRDKTRSLTHFPRVFCMEWIDPVYCSGHWIAELIELAGGVDRFSRQGSDSVRVSWKDVVDWNPEILIIALCGFNLERAMQESARLLEYPHWNTLAGVRKKRVYLVDANSYFARPGPRIIEGGELLAYLIHPDLFQENSEKLWIKNAWLPLPF